MIIGRRSKLRLLSRRNVAITSRQNKIDIVRHSLSRNLTMSDLDLETILDELRQREPIFHRRASARAATIWFR
ncbi:hypothetical protein RLV_5383 [Rhizobium leguminosarum bv. viciae]|nr:hypothetical protein RLV_5383 [Rhizobium leguminosarum bv. viciae]